jgi:uncharacterized protein YjbI with pentapeptide repeats
VHPSAERFPQPTVRPSHDAARSRRLSAKVYDVTREIQSNIDHVSQGKRLGWLRIERRQSMANPAHLEILNHGVEAWNVWRESEDSARLPDLSKAELVAKDLTGVNLAGTNLAGANLRRCNLTKACLDRALLAGAKLQEVNLTDASLEGADVAGAFFEDTSSYAPPARLTRARFKGANLPRVNFRGVDLVGQDLRRINLHGASLKDANLLRTRLREADLRDADLGGVKGGLQPEQLAGADLTGAILPEPLTKLFDELKAVGDISESARKLFIAMLAACLYSWLTIATTTDVNLITNRASSPLPIIRTSIPIVGFYVVAPLLLLCVYFYFHFYLQKLWEELGSLPAIFPDGRPLHAKSDPWLLNDLVRAHLAKLKPNRPFMSYFQQAISMVLAWWLVPVTLFLFWGRYLPRHDFRWTTLQVALLAVSIMAAVFLYRLAAATLRGAERVSFTCKGALKDPRAYAAIGTFAVAGIAFMLVSVGAIRGVPPPAGQSPWWSTEPWQPRLGKGPSGRWGWVPRAMELVRYSPFANLRDADVSIKPTNWTGNDEKKLDLVKGAELAGADLRYADAAGAFLAKANFEPAGGISDTRIEGANLGYSDLRQARLVRAHLNAARLVFAHLNGAHLNGAYLIGAYLGWAHLDHAELDGADLTGADLVGADLTGVDLGGAHLTKAKLTGAHLNNSKLGSADLSLARLNRADLTGAELSGAELSFANFKSQGNHKTEGLTAAALKTAKNWDKAYYDDDLLQQLSLPLNHNEKLEEEQKREEQQKGKPAAGTSAPAESEAPRSAKPTNSKPGSE